jgi:hypothetical protein
MGLRSEVLAKYSAGLHALEELPSSKEDEAVQERRERLVAVVADIRYGVMSPVVLVAIRKRGWNRDRQA